MITIGDFKIERLDQDHILVTRGIDSGAKMQAKICGGDMETILNTVFIQAEITQNTHTK